MKKRISEKRGESLVETIAAILIITLASVAFLTLAQTASRLNSEAEAAEAALTAEQAAAETGSGSAPASVSVMIGGNTVIYNVTAAGDSSEGALRAYDP